MMQSGKTSQMEVFKEEPESEDPRAHTYGSGLYFKWSTGSQLFGVDRRTSGDLSSQQQNSATMCYCKLSAIMNAFKAASQFKGCVILFGFGLIFLDL